MVRITNINFLKDKYTWLIVISSILLGIWATSHTIALRNSLLIIGSIVAIYSIIKNKKEILESFLHNSITFLPLLFIILLFILVLIHYFFIGNNSIVQLSELKSTWLRCFLATTLGFITGIAVIKKRNYIGFLWLGIYVSFIFLLLQYLPKAFQKGSIYAIDYYNYIYLLKINGVLAGSIFIASAVGFYIYLQKENIDVPLGFQKYFYLSGSFLVLYSFLFIFDARSGIALSVVMIIFFLSLVGINYLKKLLFADSFLKIQPQKIGLIFVIMVIFFSCVQVSKNSTWRTIIQDMRIGSQIDVYPNWIDPNKYGPPIDENGRYVTSSIYERTALFFVGLRLLENNHLGSGILLETFPLELKRQNPNISYSTAPSTHSGWIEFGLAYGWAGLFLIAIIPLANMFISVQINGIFYGYEISLAFVLVLLYFFLELSNSHALEIYFYINALITGMNNGENSIQLRKQKLRNEY